MAGYIFSLDNLNSLKLYARQGVYATKLSVPSGYWNSPHEGTFADYASMKPGDNVYFFIKRKIYGIGKLIEIGGECKFFNFPHAATPEPFDYMEVNEQLLWDEGEISVRQRCMCVFGPDPYFFKAGVDMDDVLSSNPNAFKMLRAFWKLSFIKFGDEENQAFRDIILKRNQTNLSTSNHDNRFEFQPVHQQISQRQSGSNYQLGEGISTVLASCAFNDRLKHEMAIEMGILHQISSEDEDTCNVFGKWDYLSHQVIASPFKPIDYMDKMDLFGYSYLSEFRPTKSGYLVGEIKKDSAKIQDLDQLLKYVDWVKDEYCFGDYSMIHAFLVAYDFGEDVVQHKTEVGIRKYTVGMRPAQSQEWKNIHLVKYSFDSTTRKLHFRKIN